MATIPTFTTKSFIDLVRAADPDFEYERRHPVVYRWANGAERRDPGEGGGPYANHAE